MYFIPLNAWNSELRLASDPGVIRIRKIPIPVRQEVTVRASGCNLAFSYSLVSSYILNWFITGLSEHLCISARMTLPIVCLDPSKKLLKVYCTFYYTDTVWQSLMLNDTVCLQAQYCYITLYLKYIIIMSLTSKPEKKVACAWFSFW